MKRLAIGSVALGASLAFAQPPNDAPKPVAFTAEARVEVDPDGTLVKVEAAQDLPESIRTFIEQQLKTWKYVRRHREDMTGNAATWVYLNACAVPAPGGGYTMGLAFHGNGPRIAGGGKWPVPRFLFIAVSKAQVAGRVDVHFVVKPDGTATFESMEGWQDARTRKPMRSAIEQWIEDLRFEPEEIGGRPVATRETVPLVIKLGDRTTSDDLRDKAMQSPQCKQAAAAGQAIAPSLGSVAVDSVVDIIPSI